MNFEAALSSMTSPSWLDVSGEVTKHRDTLSLTQSNCRSLLETAETAIANGDVKTASNHLFFGFAVGGPTFLLELQKKGILRCSRQSYDAETLASIVHSLLATNLDLPASVTGYLHSVSNLYVVAKDVRLEYLKLKERFEKEREVGIKSTLASLDLLFLKGAVGFHESNKQLVSSRHHFFFSLEELAEGFSSLLALYGNEFGQLTCAPAIDEEACVRGDYFDILNSAAHLAAFREWESLIDRFGYRLEKTDEANVFKLEAPSDAFERAIELGFIQNAAQRAIKTSDWLGVEGKSFHDFAPKLVHDMEEAELITLARHPSTRYRFALPPDVLTATAGVGELFLEERIGLLGASRELLTEPKKLLSFDLGGGTTFEDLFQVLRMIQFIRSITAAKLIPEIEDHLATVFQSIVPVFERAQLVELFGHVVGKDNAERIIDLLLTDVTTHVDIQYRPLLSAGSEIMLPASIFSSGNIYRNPLQVLRKRLYPDGKIDPLSVLLAEKFTHKGYDSRRGFEYDQGEIDVLVMVDGLLVALECKNSLVPSSPHELMTSLDYVRIAGDQLERFKLRLKDDTFRSWLSEKTGWQIDENTQLCTGIVLSNRMFMGWRENGHPVRGAYELEHFIDEGTISMGDESQCLWLGDTFSGEDLKRYFDEDISYLPNWKCLKPYSAKYEFANCSVCVDHLYLDQIALAEHFGFGAAKEMLIAQQADFNRLVSQHSIVADYKRRVKGVKQKAQKKSRKQRNRQLERKMEEHRRHNKRKRPEHD